MTNGAVSAETADLRERMARMETLQHQILEKLVESQKERRDNAIKVEADRKASEAIIDAALKGLLTRVTQVETDLRDYRVGGKVLLGVGSLIATMSGLIGGLLVKFGVFSGWKP
jgi:hypothetical protein